MKLVMGINIRSRRDKKAVSPGWASLRRHQCARSLLIGLVFAQCVCLTMGDSADDARIAEQVKVLKANNREGNALNDAIKELTDIGEPAIPALLNALKDPNTPTRENTGWVFEAFPGSWWCRNKSVITALIDRSRDTNADVRAVVVLALRRAESNRSDVNSCLTAALKDVDASVRANAARSLGVFARGGPEEKSAPEALLAVLNDPDHDVCLEAAAALSDMHQSLVPAVPGLASALKDKDSKTRQRAAEFLSTVGPKAKAAVPELIKAVNDEVEEVRSAACRALAEIGPDASAAIPALLAALKDRPQESASVLALADIDPRGKASVSALVEALGTSGFVRMHSNEWLTKLGTNALPGLMAGLTNTNAEVRAGAADILGEIGPNAKAALPLLTGLLKDTAKIDSFSDTGDVRAAAKGAIAKIDPQFAATSAAEGLKDKDDDARDKALESLQKVGPGALPKLLEIWGSKDSDLELRKRVSRTAYLILRDFDDANAYNKSVHKPTKKIGSALDSYVPVLIRALGEEDDELRLKAAEVLEHIGPGAKSAVPALIARLKDKFFVVRFCAARALAAIGPEARAAIPPLIECLGSEQVAEVRFYFAQALGDFGPAARDAVPVLIKVLKDDDEKVRGESALALGAIGADASAGIAPLTALLKDDNGECRTNAANALGSVAASLKEKVDVTTIPALQEALLAMEEANFPPKTLAHVRGPLDFLKKEAASGHGPPPAQQEIDRCWNLVVQLSGELDGEPVLGSGIIFGAANDRLYVVTAKHVVRRGGQITGLKASIKSLPGEPLDAELTNQSSSELDVAVVVVHDVQKHKIPLEAIPFDRLGKPRSLQAKEKVYVLGLPIARKDEMLQADEFMETEVSKVFFRSQTVRPGYSGGALFNSNWQLVGMIRADEPPIAHAIAVDQILAQLKAWDYPINLKAQPY